MKHYPNLRHVRLFHACLQTGSVSRAADMVGISQPAASQALVRLEAVFGAPLIEMKGGGPIATAEGRIVLSRAQRAIELIRTGAARLRSQADDRADGEATEARLRLPHLRALSAFAEGGSFSAAARILGQSEPAVQRTAREAEAVLGVPLFEGTGRAIRLSGAGTSAARWSRLALNELENAAAEVREYRGRYEGHVALGTLPLARTSIVPEAIAAVGARHPFARFTVAEGPYDDLLRDLEMGRIDLLIGALRRSLPSNTLVQEELLTYRLAVVARAGHPLALKERASLSDLAAYPWIVARPDTPSRETFRALAARFPRDRPARETVATGSLAVARGILMNSDHLALFSRHQIAYEMRAGFLTTIQVDIPDPDHAVGITTRRHWIPTALQSEFIATLRAITLAADPQPL